MKKKLLLILGLIGIDEFIKLYIYTNLMHIKFLWVNKNIGFLPYINKDQLSVFNKELNMELGLEFLIVLNTLLIIIAAIFYWRYKKREYTNFFSDYGIVFLMAGATCSLIDKLTLEGSLDYILFFNKIMDIKDLYLFFSIVLVMMYVLFCFKVKMSDKNKDRIIK